MSDSSEEDIWFDEVFEGSRFGLRIKEQLFEDQSQFQKVSVVDSETYGRALALDNLFMTSERDEFMYHEMLIHPAMVTAPSIKRVLVIGGGDGGSLREITKYPEVEKAVLVEIDEMVVNASREYLPTIGTAWDDPRVEVRIADGIAYVQDSADEPYDVIVLDGTDPVGPGKGLFNEEFYRGVSRMLSPEGVFVAQTESPFLMADLFVQIQKTLRNVFPCVHPYFGIVPIYASGYWSWTLAGRSPDPMSIAQARAEAVAASCKLYNPDIHRGAFAVPNFVRKALAK